MIYCENLLEFFEIVRDNWFMVFTDFFLDLHSYLWSIFFSNKLKNWTIFFHIVIILFMLAYERVKDEFHNNASLSTKNIID